MFYLILMIYYILCVLLLRFLLFEHFCKCSFWGKMTCNNYLFISFTVSKMSFSVFFLLDLELTKLLACSGNGFDELLYYVNNNCTSHFNITRNFFFVLTLHIYIYIECLYKYFLVCFHAKLYWRQWMIVCSTSLMKF